jgi:hypothetical protein
MPWMFSSTISFLPYLLGLVGFAVALIRGAWALLLFTRPAQRTYWIAYAAGVLLTTGDLVYQLDLAMSLDSSWWGLTPVPESLIEPDGSVRAPVSHHVYPAISQINADIERFWWRVAILGLGLAAFLLSLWAPKRAAEDARPVIGGEWATLYLGVTGFACLALRFVA